MLYTNVRSVRSLAKGTKREEIKILLDEHDIDVVGLTET